MNALQRANARYQHRRKQLVSPRTSAITAEYMTYTSALNKVVHACDTLPHSHLIQYAGGYARKALRMEDGTKELRVQLVYVLSNLSTWRGDLARCVRNSLKMKISSM